MKLGVIVAAALLFAAVLRRMTAPHAAPGYSQRAPDVLVSG
jgi:hypothetical protein